MISIRCRRLTWFVFGAVFLVVGNATALSLGTDITVYDGMGSGTDWHGAQEDQEVEPGMQGRQRWDLEGFYYGGTTLTLVGGFDFLNGETWSGHRYESGDIFLDTDGDSVFGTSGSGGGNLDVQNTFGYDYVLDLDFATLSYSVYALDAFSSTVTVTFSQNDESNPWRYVALDENDPDYIAPLSGYANVGLIGYWSGLNDAEVGGLEGDGDTTHNAFAVDLSFLPGDGFLRLISPSSVETTISEAHILFLSRLRSCWSAWGSRVSSRGSAANVGRAASSSLSDLVIENSGSSDKTCFV